MTSRLSFMWNEKKDKPKKFKDLAKSEWFRFAPIFRGVSEISPLLELTKKHNSYICGGYARYCASPRMDIELNAGGDIDIYSYDLLSHTNLLDELRTKSYHIVNDSEYSVTLMTPDNKIYHQTWDLPLDARRLTIQLVKPSEERKTLGNVDNIIDNFDFTVCQVAILSPSQALVNWKFYDDEVKMKIRKSYLTKESKDPKNTNNNPMVSFYRAMKYIKKGYKVDESFVFEMFEAWGKLAKNELELENAKEVFRVKFMHQDSGVTELIKDIRKGRVPMPDQQDINSQEIPF